MNALGVTSVCVSNWIHLDLKTKHFALVTKFHLLSMLLMLWLFLKSSNNSCLLLNMKDNLSKSCSQNPYTVWVVTSLATASLLSSGKVFIQLSSKWAHFVDWTSSSCTSVAIELIADLFMWHQHIWTSTCFCMPSACSMQSILDLVHALSCHWTVNLRMFFVRCHRNRNV